MLSLAVNTNGIEKSQIIERTDWNKYFTQFNAVGTIVILDTRKIIPKRYVFNKKRASTQFSPASTFKIPHSLFALNIDTSNRLKDLYKRKAVVREVLRSIKALPVSTVK